MTGSPMMSLSLRVTWVGEFREGQLGQVEFAVGGEAREALVVAEIQPVVLDAFGLDEAQPEITEMIVIRGRDGQIQLRHASPPGTVLVRCG